VANVKVINGANLDQNLNGTKFNNTTSETIFQFGSFAVTSNFAGRVPIDYTNTLSTFVRPVTLDTMGITNDQSAVLHQNQTNAVLNLDNSNLNTFVKFGSTYEFFRVSIQDIIDNYPGSLFVNANTNPGGNITFDNFTGNPITNIYKFRIPSAFIDNTFGIVFNQGNMSVPNNMPIKNLNISYNQYVVSTLVNPTVGFYVIGFTGDTAGVPYVWIETLGNPFPFNTGITQTNKYSFNIKPNNVVFEEFRSLLPDYEKYIVSQRDNTNGFIFQINDPSLLDDGSIIYSNITMLWATTDGYNLDIEGTTYQRFLNSVLTIGGKYDLIKTDLIARFLTPLSIKTYDTTEQQKMTKLLRVYGWEFDQVKKFIDALTNINTVTYNKINNIPDQLISNLAQTFGFNYFNLVNESELVQTIFSINETERNLHTDLLPAEVNIELWRRILINANFFCKSKGTRQAIKAIFLLIGIPAPFINITEYIYTVDGKINPNTVLLNAADFPNSSLPYDNSGYPQAPLESNSFYFQISGDTDSGQAYMNNFRNAGFSLMQTVDNKKSWVQAGEITRVHYDTPQYFQLDSKLVLNTKEVDVALDTAQGIEYDVYDYVLKDFAINSTGYTLPFSYVNISLGYTGTQNTFTLPTPYNKTQGTLEVRYNGILLNGPKEFSGGTGGTYTELIKADYSVSGNTFTLLTANAINSGNRRDVIEATFIYSGNTYPVSGITVQYIVTRIKANILGTIIPLPSYPRGDIQVTVNGIALTKGTPQFIADYVLDPANSVGGSNNIIIQNPTFIAYLATNPYIQVTYVQVIGSNSINARSEIVRVDSFNSGKIYFNNSANKYVYKLNYKANSAADVKMLVDGIALEPFKDYNVNALNPYEIFLPKGIVYGSIISAYYLVALSSFFTPIVSDTYGLGDISKLSFLEFIDLLQQRLINVRTRKTISDFKGGWYPALLKIYLQYLDRGLLPITDPLHSNGYTFANLYPFLSKYNAFFQKFVDELLPATIILKQGGLLIRNTLFTKQKFMYLRGVNVFSNNRIPLQYLGDDGSVFWIAQDAPHPTPPTLFVNTISGTSAVGSINNTGGNAITNFNLLTQYGMQFRTGITGNWNQITFNGALSANHFTTSLTGLSVNTSYQYRAFVQVGIYGYTGNTLQITTLASPIVPFIETQPAISTGINSINSTGGINIVEFALIQNYAMEFRTSPSGTWQLFPSIPLTGPLGINNFTTTINGLNPNTTYDYRAYMVIGGLPYRGTILTTTTQPTPTFVPTVTTGTGTAITTTGFTINNSAMTDDGGVLATEYGVLYTQDAFYGSSTNLIYSNVPTVSKVFTSTIGTTGITFTKSIIGLSPNTTTYYRAFAKNSVGVGYGVVQTIQTLPLPNIYVPLVRTNHNGTGPGQQSNGTIYPNPALSTSQCITVNFNISHLVFACNPTGGQNITTIYCCVGGIWHIVSPSPFITNSPSSGPPARCCGQYSLSVTIHQNEKLCYFNQVASNSCCACGTCSYIGISSMGSSSNITVSGGGAEFLVVG
jgi:hypothetical protein